MKIDKINQFNNLSINLTNKNILKMKMHMHNDIFDYFILNSIDLNSTFFNNLYMAIVL
jgi:hypothetical protein